MAWQYALFVAIFGRLVAVDPLPIDRSAGGQTFHGLGAISGGGATSRLLVDYPEPQKSDILDYLFKPNYGASLQHLKVEIGGDSQSTDGTEASHMHTPVNVDCNSGYEWWLLQEAKKRNPEIKTHGLPWAYPGWVGGPEQSGSPFKHPELTAKYILKWLQCARDIYGINIDYIGIWNEKSSDAAYAVELRRTLDEAGFSKTTLVAKDGGADICNEMKGHPQYLDAVGVVGLHYPSDFRDYSHCRDLGYGVKGGKPIWASEESSSYDDLNGAACWATVVTRHWVKQGITSSIMWNLIGSYYHGTNWYASSLMTAVEPWSGNYNTLEVVWTTAHMTQFTKVGWTLLDVGSGSGELPKGGYYTAYVDPNSEDWTLTVVKVNHDHARCTRPRLPDFSVSHENVTFRVALLMRNQVQLAVWYSNFQDLNADGSAKQIFERLENIVVEDGAFTLPVTVGSFYTVSTILTGPTKGEPNNPIPKSQPSMPLPYSDDFESYSESQEGQWWSDQIGSFEVHKSEFGNKVMRLMTPELPIGWSDPGSNGPYTLLGMREWQDITVSVDVKIPSNIAGAQGCVASRADQMWENGIVLCVTNDGTYTLTVGGPKLGGTPSGEVYKTGNVSPLPADSFSRLSLTTVGETASGTLNGASLFDGVSIRDVDTGFAGIGASHWMPIEYDNAAVAQAGDQWTPGSLPTCLPASAGTLVRATMCSRNGLENIGQAFDLLADWGIRHRATGLCVTVDDLAPGEKLRLQECDFQNENQKFKNDYTRVRNMPVAVSAGGDKFVLGANLDGTVQLWLTPKLQGPWIDGRPPIWSPQGGSWASWSYFPNTGQLRNQYTATRPENVAKELGYPMCLTACDSVLGMLI